MRFAIQYMVEDGKQLGVDYFSGYYSSMMTLKLVQFYRFTLCALALVSLEVKGFDHGGNEFYVTFLPFPMIGLVDQVKLYITTPESVPVTFTVSIPGKDYFYRGIVDPGGVREFTFNGADYALRNTTDRSKGIIIQAENEKQVFVYAAHDVYRTTDSFLALPPHDLGAVSYTYIAAMIHTLDTVSYQGEKADIHSLVGIVSVENDTMLTITPTHNVTIGRETVEAGNSIDVTLHRAETLLIAYVSDLTGTKVTSNRPISFFCGDQCTNVPSGVPYCDQIVEQLPPVEVWGRQFATAPLKMRMSFDVFRFVASENTTTVSISCVLSNGTQGYVDTFRLSEGGFADVQVRSTHFCWVKADKCILLLQFAVGQDADGIASDPFMALVPAVRHYTNTFTLPIVHSTFNDFTHYLNIIIPAEHYQPDQIFLNGQSLQSLSLEFVAIVHNGETMAYATQVTVSATTHTLIHGNSTGVIGVTAYGFAYHASYSHVGGMQLPQIKPLTPPTVLTVLEITSSSLTVSWRPPLGQLEEENTIHYFINVTDTKGKSVANEVNSTVLSIRVPELLPDHVYQVAVAAVSGERVGPSTMLFVKTSPVTAAGVASPSGNMTVVFTLGSLLGVVVLVVIAAVVILGIIICLCACRRKQKAKNNDPATCGTYTTQNDNVYLQQNPAYELVYPVRPNMYMYQQ